MSSTTIDQMPLVVTGDSLDMTVTLGLPKKEGTKGQASIVPSSIGTWC